MKILIVDDEPLILEVLRMLLGQMGHEVLVAEDGETGWTQFLREKPRIVIADWVMPGCSGLELCARIRNHRDAEYTYFILLTGNSAVSQNFREAMEAGVDDFLAKPAKHDEIVARLRVADRILGLTQQLLDIKNLVPICAYCKQIRNEEGEYEPVETFIDRRTKTNFTHGICPGCSTKIRARVEEDERLVRR